MAPRTKRVIEKEEGAMESFTDGLRERVKANLTTCPTCGRALLSRQKAAAQIGVTLPTLNSFIKGESVRSETIDKMMKWLESKPE